MKKNLGTPFALKIRKNTPYVFVCRILKIGIDFGKPEILLSISVAFFVHISLLNWNVKSLPPIIAYTLKPVFWTMYKNYMTFGLLYYK